MQKHPESSHNRQAWGTKKGKRNHISRAHGKLESWIGPAQKSCSHTGSQLLPENRHQSKNSGKKKSFSFAHFIFCRCPQSAKSNKSSADTAWVSLFTGDSPQGTRTGPRRVDNGVVWEDTPEKLAHQVAMILYGRFFKIFKHMLKNVLQLFSTCIDY